MANPDPHGINAELESRPKMQLEPGVHYTGSIWLNEYGEIQVKPANLGSRPGGGSFKIVSECEYHSVYESKNFWKVCIKLPKLQLTLGKALNVFSSASYDLARFLTRIAVHDYVTSWSSGAVNF